MSRTNQLNGLIRATHRFPAVANAISVAIFGALAGATVHSVFLISAAMLLVHAAIGSSNDVVDAEDDRRTQPDKPIARGLVSARIVAIAAIIEGSAALGLALLVNIACFFVILAILLSGLAYNFWAKRTIFSWTPFAVFIPSVVTAGFFAAERYEPRLWIAYPIGALIAIALNVANSIPDIEGDRANGGGGLATVLGVRYSYALTWTALSLSVAALWALHFVAEGNSGAFLLLSLLALAFVPTMAATVLLTRPILAQRANWYLTAVCAAFIGASFVVDIR